MLHQISSSPVVIDLKSWGLLQICSSWLMYILPVPSAECVRYGIYKFSLKYQKKRKKIKYVAAINVKVAILRITWVALSLNLSETVLPVILPFLLFGGPLWVWEKSCSVFGEVWCDSGPLKAIAEAWVQIKKRGCAQIWDLLCRGWS